MDIQHNAEIKSNKIHEAGDGQNLAEIGQTSENSEISMFGAKYYQNYASIDYQQCIHKITKSMFNKW